MPTKIDLRDWPQEDHREQLFEVLEEMETGDKLNVIADRDIDPDLVRYQLNYDRTLEWEYADPDAEPRKLHVIIGEAIEEGTLAMIDVRDLKPQRRHQVLLEIFDELEANEGFVLVNDHDPKPLYHELRSMYGDVVEWEYSNRESGEWRVEILKTDDSEAAEEDVITRYDVRKIPKQERHPTIHHRYGMIPEGGTLEIIAPHEPRPLREEFRQQYGDSFTWNVVESDPGRCRVRITKDDSTDAEEDKESASVENEIAAVSTEDGEIEITEELDVRALPPAQRHEQIFEAYDELATGEGFVLVNDHDPKPLYHQFEAEAGPEFRWDYRQREPGEFRVLIGKAEMIIDDKNNKGDEGMGDEGMEAPF